MEKELPRRSAKKKLEKDSKPVTAEAEPAKPQLPPPLRQEESQRKQEEKPRQSSRFQVVQRKVEIPGEAVAPQAIEARAKLSPDQLEYEAELYACIATLNSLMCNFEKGNVELATYKRQVQSLITDMMKFKVMLERSGISMEYFLVNEKIQEEYPVVFEKFKLLDSGETLESFVESLTVTKADVASSTAEIVSNLITLSDYAHLGGDIVKVESLIPIIDRVLSLLRSFPTTRGDYWGLGLLTEWHDKLLGLPADAVLTPDETSKLGLDATRLLDDFKRRLREI
ncbi:MAG: hypothetical protein WED04_01595 [Promethearchaeati archaeon SRVP18_Atabeyarchaeia-1]